MRHPRLVRLVLGSVLGLASWGCRYDSLEGSLGDQLDLRFDSVALSKAGTVLNVEYLHQSAQGTESPLSVACDLAGLAVPKGKGLNLDDATFAARCGVTRRVADGSRLPALSRGRLFLEAITFAEGGFTYGEFDLFFAEGSSLVAYFRGTIHER